MADQFHTFPATRIDALAMLYLEKQEISNLSPEELLDKYDEVHSALKRHNQEKRSTDHEYKIY